MPDYSQWNKALASYFTEGVPQGEPVRLQFDSQTPEQVAALHFADQSTPPKGWLAHFCQTVRGHCLTGERIDQDYLLRPEQRAASRPPHGLAWLCLLVLAASRMKRDEGKSSGNYYAHLRELLGLSAGSGKPSSLDYYALERLWKEWNQWLGAQGWQATAFIDEQGERKRYINYAIGQCLLREGEAEQLMRLWQAEPYPTALNRQQFRQRLGQLAAYQVHRRLHQDLLENQTPELYEKLFALYLDGNWQHLDAPQRKLRQVLEVGLYRHEDFRTDAISYLPYVRQRQHQWGQDGLAVMFDGQQHRLSLQRMGWYTPLNIQIRHPEQRLELEAAPSQSPEQQPLRLVMPGAEVWALVADPDALQSGIYASWQRPLPGEPFLLLCHQRQRRALEKLMEQKLLNVPATANTPYTPPEMPDWLEYYGCELPVLSAEQWQQLRNQAPLFWEVLHPQSHLQISCRGGLRARNQQGQWGWLAAYPPCLGLSANTPAQLQIQRLQPQAEQVWEGPFEPGQVYLQGQPAGLYQLELVTASGQRAEKTVRLLSWAELSLPLPENGFDYEMENGMKMRGGLLSDV